MTFKMIASFFLAATLASAQTVGTKAAVHTVLDSAEYFAVAMLGLGLGFKILDWFTPGELLSEIGEKQNLSLAVLAAGGIAAQAMIVAAAFGISNIEDPVLFPIFADLASNLIANSFIWSIGASIACGICFKLLDWVTPSCCFKEQLLGGKNLALGTFLGGANLAVGIVMAAIIRG